MILVASDILAELCGLSLGLIIAILPVGLMLTLFGWRTHRFWIVLATTITAGIFGMLEATTWKVQPIVIGILLAIAAGVLALALVRVVTFAAGGIAAVYAIHFAFPALHQQLICFLVGGLVCLLIFRWYFMALTSFIGSVLLAHGILAILHYQERLDAVVWSDDHITLLNILCGVGTLIGFGFQAGWERRRNRKEEKDVKDTGGAVGAVLARIGFGKGQKKAA